MEKKMKQNAFTIVELLTTIIILGIVMGVAVVAYAKYIDSSKNKTYQDAEVTLRAAAESFFTYCATSPFASEVADCKTMPNVLETADVNMSTLVENGFMDEVVDHFEGGHCTGSVKVTNKGVQDNYDLEYQVCLRCSDYKSKDCQ